MMTSWNKVEIFHNIFSNSQVLKLNSEAAGVMPIQGVRQLERIGDRENVLGWKIRLLIGLKGDRPNLNFRWICFSLPKASGIGYSSVFSSSTNNVMLDEMNRDVVKVLGQGTWCPNQAGLSATNNDEYTVKKMFIPHKRVYKFGPSDTSAVTHNQDDVYFSILCYDAYGSLASDNIAYFQCYSELLFKDP